MEFITTKEVASRWGVTPRTVNRLCLAGRITGAKLVGKTWFIPDTAIRPVDGRTKIATQIEKHNEDKNKRFIFPIIPYSSYIHSYQYFTKEERDLYEAQLSFYRCNYTEAYTQLNALLKKAESIYVRMGCLFTLAELCVFFGHRKTFEEYKKQFNDLFKIDFPFKKDLLVLQISMDVYDKHSGDSHAQYTKLFHYLNYDKHVFPFFYVSYSFELMNDYILKHRLADLEGIEIVVMQMETENIPLALQSMHVYMAIMYQLSGQQEKANEHLLASLDIAKQHGFYHNIALSYQFIAYSWDKVLTQYDPKIRDFILEKKEFLVRNYVGGHVAEDIFKTPKSGYYLELALYVINGFTNKEIAQIMGVSESKIRNAISNVFEIVGVTNRKELSEYALKLLKSSKNKGVA